ncbi:MAG: hypothetical protein Q7V01_08245 [Vicinamibacterales bacterium]|nr:hypothetical protein [Vicinamibacterales bacterium]
MNNPATLTHRLHAALMAALVGAGVASAVIAALYVSDPGARLEMAGPHPPVVTGLYPPERSEQLTFAWSGAAMRLVLPGADRRVSWVCGARVINWRPPTAGPAAVRVTAGAEIFATTVTDAEATFSFTVPASTADEPFDVTMAVTPTFRPGARDPRHLGLAFDWIRCEPSPGARAWPPAAAVARGAATAALLGAAIGAAGVAATPAAVLAGGAAVVHGITVTLGVAPFAAGPPFVLLLVVVLIFLAPLWFVELTGWHVPSSAGRVAVALSAAACFLKLGFILHPGKPLVDALFHAHRFQAVLGGEYYFTQLSTSATPFPYAIGLYVFAAPWAWLTRDHVTLLRVVVYAAEAGAGLLLYAMLARAWQSRAAGAAAVALFHLVPLPYAVIGNANLTNAFGQSASLAVLAAVTLGGFVPLRAAAAVLVVALATLAFISHVSVVVLLGSTLAGLGLVSWWIGERDLRAQARHALAAALLGAVLAVVVYWGHFGNVYAAQIARTRVGAAIGLTPPAAPARDTAADTKPARRPFTYAGPDVARQAVRDFGWPLLALAVAGAWESLRRRDRLAALIVAQLGVAAVFLTFGSLAPIAERMQQDAWEFMGRVDLATTGAVVMLAAVGAERAWRAGLVGRAITAVLVGAAVIPAVRAIQGWFP